MSTTPPEPKTIYDKITPGQMKRLLGLTVNSFPTDMLESCAHYWTQGPSHLTMLERRIDALIFRPAFIVHENFDSSIFNALMNPLEEDAVAQRSLSCRTDGKNMLAASVTDSRYFDIVVTTDPEFAREFVCAPENVRQQKRILFLGSNDSKVEEPNYHQDKILYRLNVATDWKQGFPVTNRSVAEENKTEEIKEAEWVLRRIVHEMRRHLRVWPTGAYHHLAGRIS